MTRNEAKVVTRFVLERWRQMDVAEFLVANLNGYRIAGTQTGRIHSRFQDIVEEVARPIAFVDPPYDYQASHEFIKRMNRLASEFNVVVMTAAQNRSKGQAV